MQDLLQKKIKTVLKNIPEDWIKLTTHRLDIYNEDQAKTEFLEAFEKQIQEEKITKEALMNLPTAYDYIRLGHPLSCVLEWCFGKKYNLPAVNCICFASKTMPILAVLRTNQEKGIPTRIISDKLPEIFNTEMLQEVYEYNFEVVPIHHNKPLSHFEGKTIYINETENIADFAIDNSIDFYVNIHATLGSILLIPTENSEYVSKIQHVRRRESIAMTPSDSLTALQNLIGNSQTEETNNRSENFTKVQDEICKITGASAAAIVGSSGLSVQYAIMMGLVAYAKNQYPKKPIAFLVPPNCYGGTNDQARRVAASITNVSIVDLPVDGENDMVQSLHTVLDTVAKQDAVPFIIAEIPTNPRVEVPNMNALAKALEKDRITEDGNKAIKPVFILDQTFCPNTSFLREKDWLCNVQTIAYVSGSKFPSGGKCTAGYCVTNNKANKFLPWMEQQMTLCDNHATSLQLKILAEQLPSMITRIADAYRNTREFVNFIEETLPDASINFVSEELAKDGFTPSVFSLDLPTKGDSPEEREAYKRKLNLELISMMITEIPEESKYCVSYGQLKGCYWTIPATSTQGTTKESDKDYIARVSVSPDLDLKKHKEVFKDFVKKHSN